MMTEDQYILYLFEKNFSLFREKRLVLYGKGPYTGLILEHFPEYNIVGIMDRDINHGVIYGKPVISYEDLPYYHVDIIVPVARPESLPVIFQRIYQQCVKHHIAVYALNGDNLFETCELQPEEVPQRDFIEVFRETFRDCKGKRIVLYGKGPRTGRIVEECPEFPVVGIMDREVKEGELFGKQVLDYEQAAARNVDMIIAVARPEHLPHIYHRIKDFCSYHRISLYDAEGNSLFLTQKHTQKPVELHPYFEVSEKELRAQIRAHEVISFDVFDTLIMRKTLYPTDVYEIVEHRAEQAGFGLKDFKTLRRRAELDTIAEIANIYGIYDRLQEITRMTDEQKCSLLELELQTEKAVMIRRDKMVEIMEYALSLGKPVYLISDMYLTKEIIGEILDGLGIRGYQKLYVSCEYHKNKVTGIYEVYKAEVPSESRLHIGDHPHSDGIDAKAAGLDAFTIKKAIEMLNISAYAPVRCYTRNLNERSMVGLFISKVFQNPFALYHTDGRRVVSDVQEFGYAFVAPLITEYMIWLVERLAKETDWTDILFSARDGFLIQQLYQKLLKVWNMQEMPQGIYFQASRHAVTCASMQTEDDIRWISKLPYSGTPEMMIHQSFDLPMEQVLPFDEKKYEDMVSYGLAHKEMIFANSKKLAGRYLKYMKKLGMEEGKTYILWDLVASGTCHFGLEKIAPFFIKSLYLCNYDSEKPRWRELPADAMIIQNLQYNDNTYASYKTNQYFFKNYFLLETMITSLGTTLLGFTEEGEPLYGEEVRSELELQYVMDVQKSITDFFEDYVKNLYVRGSDMTIHERLTELLYQFKDSPYTKECCEVLDHIYLHEEMIHGKMAIERK